jgi:hypothetical protein
MFEVAASANPVPTPRAAVKSSRTPKSAAKTVPPERHNLKFPAVGWTAEPLVGRQPADAAKAVSPAMAAFI